MLTLLAQMALFFTAAVVSERKLFLGSDPSVQHILRNGPCTADSSR